MTKLDAKRIPLAASPAAGTLDVSPWHSQLLTSDLFHRIVESAGEGIWIIDAEGRTQYANPRMLAILGVSPAQIKDRPSFDFVPPEDVPFARAQFESHIKMQGRPFEARLLRADGRIVWVRVSSTLLRDPSGNVAGLAGLFSDITEERQTAERLTLAEDRLRLAVDAAGLGTFNCPYPLSKLIWNETCRRHLFLPDGVEPTIEIFFQQLHPDDRTAVSTAIANSARQHSMYDAEYRTVSAAGQTKWIRAIGRHEYDANGNPIRLDGVTIDITDRKLLEQALRDESLTTQTLYALSKTLVTEFDNEKLVQTITDAGRTLTGAAFGAFFYNTVNEQGEAYMLYTISGVPREAFSKFPMPRATALFGPTFRGEGAMRSGDITKDPRYGKSSYGGMPAGHLPVKSYLAVPVISRFGHVIGGLFYGHPETDRFSERDERTLVAIASHAAIALDNARLLNEARQASAAKDQFLAVLSHELRTPLNPVLITATVMAGDQSLPAEVRKNADVIRRNVELEARLIDDMLDLTRIARGKLELDMATTDVHQQLAHVKAMFEAELREKQLSLSLSLAAEHHHVHADPARLHQIWWNLLRNAIKFTDPGGQITIQTRNAPAAATTGDGALPGLIVEVIDTGIGLEPAQLGKLFGAFEQVDPAISRRYGGLGLGLSISRSLAEVHGGKLTASSAGRGRGATFTTLLPTVSASALPAEACDIPAGHSTTPLRILLVEDHVDTAQTMARLLASLGHRVTVAHTVASATDLADHHTFDVFLCDIGLPDGTGIDFLVRIPENRRPCAIALTGYGMEEDVQRSLRAGFADHLTKPLNVNRLLQVLSQLPTPKT